MEKIFELKNVSKKINVIFSLRKLNLDIYKKDIICFIGENGSGKTSLLNLLSKTFLTRGRGFVTKKEVFNEQQIGYMFQKNSFPINLKVKRILKIIKWNEKDSEFYNFLYKELQLEDILSNKLFQLSGGEKQKVNLFQILVSKPKILILDEYSNSIDVPTAKKLKKIILEYANDNDATILMASHKKDEMYGFCKKIVVLRNGSIVQNIENKNGFSNHEIDKIIGFLKIKDLE